ncbi:metallophosphoesterase family protein [Acidianus manzaensis]|uniref:Metal-dependent phosphodiesterase n=1 Tax=Acidianus manzaensis TaxID=282676 RepID=A0A1W6K3B3_9CREN|nr:metallophosphoesterase family protein [Acidianus manzaensis]ARM76924.1 metal-dependent phosphodiesterase [Acidianus manzaensis]
MKFRELELEINDKVLVLSDIHYPHCNIDEIREITRRENPSLIILLGDIIVSQDYKTFLDKLQAKTQIVYVKGDEDKCDGDTDILKLKNYNKNYLLLHGHQYFNERNEYQLAKFLMKINKNIPPFLFCLFFRLALKNLDNFLILGHSHALKYFKSIRCANAGTLSLVNNLYNDRGYIILDKKGIEVKTIK